MMRRTILGGLLAAALALPAVAQAKPATMPMMSGPRSPTSPRTIAATQDVGAFGNQGSIGGGMLGENQPGHTAGPGAAKIDNDSRGPVNDVQVGRGTDDVPQSKNPPPAR